MAAQFSAQVCSVPTLLVFVLRCTVGMQHKNDEDKKEMLEWEKVNAVEHVRKANIAEQEKLENRVNVIEDRCAHFLSTHSTVYKLLQLCYVLT